MMQIHLITVGKLKEKWLRDAYAEYDKRLQRYCRLTLTELPEARLSESPSDAEIAAALQQEGKAILHSCRGKIITLCIEGKLRSSEEFAEMLDSAAVSGDSTVSFVIGSSFGLSDEVKKAADLRFSMSPMTFTHQIARVLLMEQLYRAFQISTGG
ncbi:MAG: 23S rRNA (pseudouridine(1915)-N(3))-methyltransferase RlmH, partial [Oscillospiraceae bacterium]|nr:23S rRNA (pseudouridine(1915)-N(3))-methyltransferase RlmH [Oscillospiraceae bacterium]